MKKTILFLFLITIISCSKNDSLNQIEQNIKENASGADIGYVKGEKPEEKILNFKEVAKIYKNFVGDDPSIKLEEQIKTFKDGANIAKKDNDSKEYWNLTARYKNLESWKNLKPEDKVYSIYKYTYKINNFLSKGEKREITNYYIFDKEDKLITKINNSDVEQIRTQAINSPDAEFLIAVMQEYEKPNDKKF